MNWFRINLSPNLFGDESKARTNDEERNNEEVFTFFEPISNNFLSASLTFKLLNSFGNEFRSKC